MTQHILTHLEQILLFYLPIAQRKHKDEYRVRSILRTICRDMSEYLLFMYEHYTNDTGVTNMAFNQITFVNVNMSEAQNKQFDTWANDVIDGLDQLIAGVMIDGCKLSISYNTERTVFYASLTTTDTHKQSPNKGYSSFSGNPIEALLLTLFKYDIILKGDLNKARDQSKSLRG